MAVTQVRRKKVFYKKALAYLACYCPVPNRMRVFLHKFAGVRFADPYRAFIGYNVFFDIWSDETTVCVGEYVCITSGVRILTHFYDTDKPPHLYYTGSVNIGDKVFIGINAVVAKPVTIGAGAVVAANSLVTRDVPPYSIAIGVPAVVVGKRPQ